MNRTNGSCEKDKRKLCELSSERGLGLRVNPVQTETIAQRHRGCSLSRVGVNGVIVHVRPGGRTNIVTL